MSAPSDPTPQDLTRRVERQLNDLLDQLAEDEGSIPHDDRYRLDSRIEDQLAIVRISGLVLQSPPDEFVARLNQELQMPTTGALVIDLADCKYLCKEALRHLVLRLGQVAEHSGLVVMTRPHDKLLRLIEVAGLADNVMLIQDIAMARELFRNRGLID